MLNVQAELAAHLRFKERLLTNYPAIDEETLADTLEGLSDLNEMLLATLRHARRDEAMAAALKSMIADLGTRLGRIEDRAEKLREQVAMAMEEAEIKKLTAPDMTVSLRPTPRKVIVTDEAQIPADYFEQPPPRLDKRMVKKALDDGYSIPGAQLSNGGYSIQVRVL